MAYIYEQSTGLFYGLGPDPIQGYSGHGDGKNNPVMENVPNVGPIPTGFWLLGAGYDDPHKGLFVWPLQPIESKGTKTYGRSGFLIHGDSIAEPGSASEGCIILPRAARQQLKAGDEIVVVERVSTDNG